MRFGELLKQSFLIIAMVWFLQSCTNIVAVEGTVPTPLVSVIPAQIGVYYSDEFRNFKHEEDIPGAGSWRIELGEQNLGFFRNLTKSLFAGVREVHQPALATEENSIPEDVFVSSEEIKKVDCVFVLPEEMRGLDGVFIPTIEKYGFLPPWISGLKFYSVSIEYRVVICNEAGVKMGDWNIVGYGKSEGKLFSLDHAVKEATLLAIRDGGARIAIELIDQPAVQNWLQSIRKPMESSSGSTEIIDSLEVFDGLLDE